MFVKTKEVKAKLDSLTAMADAFGYELKLVNGLTHEVKVPEPDAIKAGFIAGLVTAGAIALGDIKNEPTQATLIAGMKIAGKVYLEEFLAREHPESDGVDNG